ncbi:cobalt-precorrin-6A reductase [Tunturiibacter empetritectus]|uniref:Precorrin-6A/cobalt-precorrin-6A reductase n=1 Tax=Tunturiibacter lichenicola TaxID=2051959 RepID=A0A852VE47_9BACT|nr:cobalt-precorrin-6A reductase [Edaphobacter lichenicola]NYF89511.1 precorrin-6A/cobalt-precorrin-6A reductase [Edaphobacter lichenicola]
MADLDPTSGEIRSARGPQNSQRILILGGTGEGTELALRLAHRPDLYTISSLAGRVSEPKRPEGIVRVGGFGGVDGLVSFLVKERIGMVVDVTHPFAVRISHNAELACARLGLSLIAFIRPPWTKTKADIWHEVKDFKEAASLVDFQKRRVLLSIGRQELNSFAACHNAWFLIRAIEEPNGPLPRFHQILLQRGPFDLSEELRLLENHSINYVVSKNSGGPATYTKIQAAQLLKIPVVMVKRPVKHTASTVETLEEVLMEVDRLIQFNRTTR